VKRSKSGEPLWRDFKVRVCIPEQKDIVWRAHAAAKRGYAEANLDSMIEQAADYLEKKYPAIKFRMVESAPNRITFIYAGRKESMSNLNGCPEVARAPKIAEEVCAKQGHKLSVFQNGMTHGPNGPSMNTINFCSNCGLSLAEVRGDLDQRIDLAIQEGIKARLNAAANAKTPAPAGVPGIEIVPDLKAKAAVESPS
jgi:hypothetical protein